MDRREIENFIITDDHVKLIRKIIINTDFNSDDDFYPVVIGVNSKRPFNNLGRS